MKQRIAIFPGSFDPYTNGHHDVVMRAMDLFDKIIIAFGVNSNKKRTFGVNEMSDKLKELYRNDPKIEIAEYSGLTIEFALENDAEFILRGLRNGTDLEYEMPIASVNRQMEEGIETIFMLTRPEYSVVSSTIVRELLSHGREISHFLPYPL